MKTVVRIHQNYGKNMVDELKKKYGNENLLMWEDSFISNNDENIISFWDVKKIYNDNELDKIILTPFYIAENVIEEVLVLGIPEEKVFVYEGIINKEFLLTPLNEFVFLPYLEIHAADHCNLNCKGCSAFCPLLTEPKFPNYETFKKDLKRLKELVPFIRTIQVMGGEPTLNPDLHLFLNYIKTIYPYSNLKLMTNGLLLKSLSQRVWDSIIDNGVTIDISCYPAVYNNMKDIVEVIRKHGAKEPVLNQISEFYPNLSEFQKYPFRNIDHCRCYNLRDGKISSCNMIMYGNYYNSFFNKNLPFESGIYDIYNKDLTGKDLVKKLNQPVDMCNYCAQYIWCLNPKYAKKGNWDFYKKNEVPQEKDWY